MAIVYLGLGANIGDRKANLRSALARLSPETVVVGVSSLYETEPVGYTAQPNFLNAVAQVETTLAPVALLRHLKSIEAALGRTERQRNAPRPVDLDILFYDAVTVDDEDLTIPHPRLAERAFTLVPLSELAPDLEHPWLGRPMRELLEALLEHEAINPVEGPDWAADLLGPAH